jgi:hypothetical protein
MEHEKLWIELHCPACDWRTTHDAVGIAQWLRTTGRLRSHSEASADELRELALALAGQIPCPACAAVGLTARVSNGESDDWPMARRCEACGQPISAERLEVLPDASLCAECQLAGERGEHASTQEYCAKCGSPLVVRPTRGAGIRRYRLVCSNNPPCR